MNIVVAFVKLDKVIKLFWYDFQTFQRNAIAISFMLWWNKHILTSIVFIHWFAVHIFSMSKINKTDNLIRHDK